MGFSKSKSAKNNIQQNLSTETNETNETTKPINVYYKGAFACLLQVLGLNDTLVYYDTIPQWIKDGSDLVKREFLAGVQGGCGGIIAYKNEKNGSLYQK